MCKVHDVLVERSFDPPFSFHPIRPSASLAVAQPEHRNVVLPNLRRQPERRRRQVLPRVQVPHIALHVLARRGARRQSLVELGPVRRDRPRAVRACQDPRAASAFHVHTALSNLPRVESTM